MSGAGPDREGSLVATMNSFLLRGLRLRRWKQKQLFDLATPELAWSHPRVAPRSILTRVCVMLARGG
jgi:hypothetical protein